MGGGVLLRPLPGPSLGAPLLYARPDPLAPATERSQGRPLWISARPVGVDQRQQRMLAVTTAHRPGAILNHVNTSRTGPTVPAGCVRSIQRDHRREKPMVACSEPRRADAPWAILAWTRVWVPSFGRRGSA